MSSYPEPHPYILDIAPYKQGDSSTGEASRKTIKLSSNENPYGPSPAAVTAYRAAADSLALYPEGSARALREAAAERYALNPDHIVCGAGSDELIALLCSAYLAPGDNIVQSRHGFLMYAISAKRCGAETIFAPEKKLTADVDAILACVNERTKIVFLANPNNPTGTFLPRGEIRRLLDALPSRVVLALDNAYAEYADDEHYDACDLLIDEFPNLASLHTCSKIYGLAALRAGWCYASAEITDALHRTRGPFNISAPAIAAASAAIRDFSYTKDMQCRNAYSRKELAGRLKTLGFECVPSQANFVLADCGSPERARELDATYRRQGVIVRRVDGYGLPSYLRITVGREEEIRAVLQATESFVRAERKVTAQA
ncbi:MAG: histidinol-phosphate transaminase [Rickettsiales bacterium]